jgi:hypothetical protein
LNATLLSPELEIERDIAEHQESEIVAPEPQVRSILHPDSVLEQLVLTWHPGKLGGNQAGKTSRYTMTKDQPIVVRLGMAMAWFGPFALPGQYRDEKDPRRKERIRDAWRTEKDRYLKRYDYPMNKSGSNPDMRPIGPHRSPDVIVMILAVDGSESKPIRLHELYGVGEWDQLKDQFVSGPSVDEIEARYREELEAKDHEIREMRRDFARLEGMIIGASATAPAAPLKSKG